METATHEDDKPKAEHQDVVAGKADGKARKRRELPPRDRLTLTYDDGSTGHRLVARRRFVTSFSRDDAKLFWITFGGTVAGTVASVMIVAVAVLLAKSTGLGALTWAYTAFYIAVTVLGTMFAVKSVRGMRGKETDDRIASLGLAIIGIIIAMLFALTLLGFAVGVR